MNKRTHDFIIYLALNNHIDDDQLSKDDLKWMVKYLDRTLDLYASVLCDKCQKVLITK